MWHNVFANDKVMVIIAIVAIAIGSLFTLADASAKEICLTSLGALGGLVVGQVFKKSE